MLNGIRIATDHFLDRFREKSTYAAIVTAVIGGAALSSPYSWLAIIVGVAGVLLPTS